LLTFGIAISDEWVGGKNYVSPLCKCHAISD